MGQVPEKCESILLVGNGRLAKHIACYAEALGYRLKRWHRQGQEQKPSPSDLKKIDTILLAISDSAIPSFIDYFQNSPFLQARLVHFSGALSRPEVLGCHPLYTFGDSLYTLQEYQNIPLVFDQKGEWFPALANPKYFLEPEHHTLYHALCTLAGNLPQWLILALQEEFKKMSLPPQLFLPLLKRSVENMVQQPKALPSGPLARKDYSTIEAHRLALTNSKLEPLYTAFIETFKNGGAE